MRFALRAVLHAACALALMAPAQAMQDGTSEGRIALDPLAAGEVLLELNAAATVTARADLATIRVRIMAPGDTPEAARRSAEAQLRRLVETARSAGVAAGDIESELVTAAMMLDVPEEPPPPPEAFPGEDPVVPTEVAPPEPAPWPRASAQGRVTIRIRNIDLVEAIEDAVRQTEAQVESTAYSLVDSAPVRQRARSQALASARADADAYAAAVGMRVLRVVRVTERLGMDAMTAMMSRNRGLEA